MRLINASGVMVGILSRYEALQMARNDGLDLVEVSPTAVPPVARIMDYGKFLFEQNKKERAARKNQKQVETKETQLSPNIDEGDYQTKLRKTIEFLAEGNKVKVVLRFRGREMQHQDIGRDLLSRVTKDLEQHAVVEQKPSMEGKQILMVFAPKKVGA